MRALILGNGVSGKSAYRLLKDKGYDVEFLDEKYLGYNYSEKLNKKVICNLDRLLDGLSFIVISPGIDINNSLISYLKTKNIKVIGELELGYLFLKGDIIAITGTNGKTTTSLLIKFLLNGYTANSYIGGNIGTAVTSFADKTNYKDITVLECSSYQLESIDRFKPNICAILNISEDHLARHKSMQNYISAKHNITKNQDKNDVLLINADCELLMQNIPKTNAKIYYFSTKHKVLGCYIKDNCIYFNDNLNEVKLVSLEKIKLLGMHNLSNILCSVLAVYLLTGQIKLLENISNFQGVEHRIEFVKTINGVSFYNDSKATNIDSTLVAVNSFKNNINLILGGSEKGYDFDKLFQNLPDNVSNIVVFGQTKLKIYNCAKKFGFKNIYKCDTLRQCTLLLYSISKSNDIILLSPACASFDHFKNFEERGCVFKKIVKEIDISENALFECKEKPKI